MKKSKKRNIYILATVGVLVIAIALLAYNPKEEVGNQAGEYIELQSFTECLKDTGAVFYGASWCSHCQAQKKSFGQAAKYLPYVECSTPGGQGQTSECQQKKITGYPTWEFSDGTRLSGNLELSILAEKTKCLL